MRLGGERLKLERPRGLEPPPTAWQAVVLPLYYGRPTAFFFYSTHTERPQGRRARRGRTNPRNRSRYERGALSGRLADPDDSRSFHHGRFLLPLCKIGRLRAVGVDPGEPLAIAVEDRHLPVAVLASLVFAEFRALSLFQGCAPTRTQHYADFAALAQVPS